MAVPAPLVLSLATRVDGASHGAPPASLAPAMTIAHCWLHIGTEKTGSTAIQTFFAENRRLLLSRGWLYPETAGIRAHHSLLPYCLDEPDGTRRGAAVHKEPSPDQFRRQIIGSLETEVDASSASVLVLSNERLATRLRRPAEIARLKALCDRLAQKTSVIVYLRNQADFLASRYTNVIWEGGVQKFAFTGRAPFADYALLLDRWAGVFGKENLVVRRFETTEFPAGNVIADFAGVTGLDLCSLRVPPRANPSLDTESLAFLRGLNRRIPLSLAEHAAPLRAAIVRVLQRRRGGTRFAIPPALAERIEETYRDSNERVSRDYFDSRYRPLFSPPALVGGSIPPPPMGVNAAARIGLFLAAGLVREGVIGAARRLLRRG